MNAFLSLLRTLNLLLEACVEAQLPRELALYLKRRRLQAAEAELEARNERLAQALVDGDVELLDASIVDVESALDDAGL